MSADVLLVGAGGPIGAALERRIRATGGSVRRTSRRGADVLDVARHDEVGRVLAETRPRAVAYLVNAAVDDDRAVDAACRDLSSLIQRAAEHGVERVVLSSSGAVYGDAARTPRSESDALDGATLYARMKQRLEAETARASEMSGVAWTALRIFNVYGPGCAASLVNRLTDGSRPTLLVTPGFVRDYVHVDDVADAFVRAFAVTGGGVYNVGSGRATTNAQLHELAPTGGYVAGGEPDADFWTYSVADTARVREFLGWRARHSVLDWMRNSAPN